MVAATLSVLALSASSPCAPENAPVDPGGDTVWETLYRSGVTFAEFIRVADDRRERWERNYGEGTVAPALVTRATAVVGTWRLLVIAEDWCSDSVSTIPYLARLAERVPDLDLRIIDSDVGRELMERHRTPDGRAATPTVFLLDDTYELAGCWVERPSELQRWALGAGAELGERAFVREKMGWYENDGGSSTVEDIVGLMEAAGAGRPICPSE